MLVARIVAHLDRTPSRERRSSGLISAHLAEVVAQSRMHMSHYGLMPNMSLEAARWRMHYGGRGYDWSSVLIWDQCRLLGCGGTGSRLAAAEWVVHKMRASAECRWALLLFNWYTCRAFLTAMMIRIKLNNLSLTRVADLLGSTCI